jgi:hypothetical protein
MMQVNELPLSWGVAPFWQEHAAEGWSMMNKPLDPTGPRAKKTKARKGAENKQLTEQNRKILGKHYANKYRTGRK